MTHDLTTNTEAWCLMSPEKRAAFMEHEGPILFLADDGGWGSKFTGAPFRVDWVYRAAPQPVRGEVVYHGSLNPIYSWHPGTDYSNTNEPARVTLPTLDGKLIPGTYTGPDGATIKIEVL